MKLTGPITLRDPDGAHVGTPDNPLSIDGAAGDGSTVADGADVCQGTTTDAAATAGGTGTLAAKLRKATGQMAVLGASDDAAVADPTATASIVAVLKGALTVLEDAWDSVGHTLKIADQDLFLPEGELILSEGYPLLIP